MNNVYLDFEKPLAELQQKIEELQSLSANNKLDVSGVIPNLTKIQASCLIEQLLER